MAQLGATKREFVEGPATKLLLVGAMARVVGMGGGGGASGEDPRGGDACYAFKIMYE
uniref:Uncharacterized protein n=2 Tax=Oryza TaxID=4527 RepID=A0A0E0PK60_ORYRU